MGILLPVLLRRSGEQIGYAAKARRAPRVSSIAENRGEHLATQTEPLVTSASRSRSLHKLGVVCGLTAGVWLGAAEAPTKFVTAGVSPFLISLGMVCGVFVARWTLPTILKGTGYVFHDLREKPHLIVWALLAGALWSVANTLSAFAIRDVSLEIAFPLWNTASLVGLLWGWLFFRELHGAGSA